MAGIQINALPAVPSAQLTDVFPVDQGATTYKETNAQLLSLFQANGAALTKIDDTNVTMTLGGAPTISLLNATSMTLGWNGQLSLARGGTNKNITANNGALVYCDADSFELLAATATAGQIPRSGANSAPTWSTATYPAAAGTSGNVLSSDGTNWVSTASAGIGSPLTTKGDLYTFTTVNARLPVGTTNGQVLQVASGAASGLAWSTASFPSTATNAARILRSDGTNWVETTSTFADTYAASGFLYANGSNNVAGLATANNGLPVTGNTGIPVMLAGPAATGRVLTSNAAAAPSWSTSTFPSVGGGAGNILISDGTNYIASTSLWPNTVGTAGKLMRSDGTTNTYTTSTYPDTNAVSTLLYASSANVMAALATANNGILVTSAGGVPSIGNTVGAGLTMPSITFNSTSGIIGTTTNDNAAAGSVGEFLNASALGVSLTSGAAKNITSFSLSAGDYDVWGWIEIDQAAGTTASSLGCSVSTTSNTISAPNTQFQGVAFGSGATNAFGAPMIRVSLASSATVYLVGMVTFAVSTCSASGALFARRVR